MLWTLTKHYAFSISEAKSDHSSTIIAEKQATKSLYAVIQLMQSHSQMK